MVFANIGGFVIDIFGYKGFIPNEEIDYKTFTNKTSYLNLTIDCRIVRLDDAKKMFVLSHKDCLSYNIPKFLEEATETIKSKVISLSSDKILFDLNQFYGYISLSENPDILKSMPHVDKIYDIKVIGFDENRQLFKLKLHP